MKALSTKHNFLGIEDEKYYNYASSKFVIQQVPYEYTSSYLAGSKNGPSAIVKASQYVELYDEELDAETYKSCGIATLKALDFKNKTNKKAVDFIERETLKLLNDKKFVVSFGAEHTVTYGFVKAHAQKFKNLSVLQIDAHSDLRESYHNNIYSHASVMKRIYDMGLNIVQAGIRAQCIEEAQLIKKSKSLHTYYAHQIRKDSKWADKAVNDLSENVYLTIDADGFDPSVIPAVGTAEPNGLFWNETLNLIEKTAQKKNIVGFDIVECAPAKGNILSEYTLAKLAYRIIGYLEKARKR
ncbi:MAG TPA: agmatinase [Bacteroidia bacterium]|jgi:agmatinase|nr:agmatinase [Bacteroidia bacterium]HMU20336.1 agmatinase [Bacteroidia bacterium]